MGIFPYVLKLLQTTTPELRQILVFIWTKILALDKVYIEMFLSALVHQSLSKFLLFTTYLTTSILYPYFLMVLYIQCFFLFSMTSGIKETYENIIYILKSMYLC